MQLLVVEVLAGFKWSYIFLITTADGDATLDATTVFLTEV